MSTIDKQRIEAVRTLERFGFAFNGIERTMSAAGPAEASLLAANADAMRALLVIRTDKLSGCAEGSVEATELVTIADTIERYEAVRWPDGRTDAQHHPATSSPNTCRRKNTKG
jgi:hypothetical protein